MSTLHKPGALLVAVLALGSLAPGVHAQDGSQVAVEVGEFTRTLVRDLSLRGPIAWLDHFDRGETFYMASDGKLIFPDYPTADQSVKSFAPTIETLQLMLDDLKVYPVTTEMAQIASPFREVLLEKSGQTISFGGFVSGTVVKKNGRWMIRNLHWSILPPADTEEEESR